MFISRHNSICVLSGTLLLFSTSIHGTSDVTEGSSATKDDPCTGFTCPDNEVCLTGCEGKDNNCVPKPECKPITSSDAALQIRVCRGQNERFLFCGSRCEDTCDEPNKSCTGCAWLQCQCNSGYVRDKSWKCVRLADCPKTCDQLGCRDPMKCDPGPPAKCVWKTCADLRCHNPWKCQPGIPARCIPYTCDDLRCGSGYKCDKLIPPHCVPMTCADIRCDPGYKCDNKVPPKCEPMTCADINCDPGYKCDKRVPPKCEPMTCADVNCDPGYKCDNRVPPKCEPMTCRDIQCDREYKCDNKIPARCTYRTCSEMRCGMGHKCIEGQPVRCVPTTCADITCDPGYKCEDEFFAHCVPKRCADLTCPRGEQCVEETIVCVRPPCIQPPAKCVPDCRRNEVFKFCGDSCEPTCEKPNQSCPPCIPNVCQCKDGYVRRRRNCIRKNRCNWNINTDDQDD